MGGLIGLIKDLLILYVTIRLIFIWAKGDPISPGVGILVVILFLGSIFFMLQRIGVIRKL